MIDEWPMNVWSALALTPAAIIRVANVWRHSWRVTGSSPRALQARSARCATIPGALDADQAAGEIDAVPDERLQLAAPQAGVEGCRPERAGFGWRVVDERQGLDRGHDPGAAAANGRELDAGGRVRADVALAYRAPADRSQRQQRVAHGRRVQPTCDEPVDQSLNVTGANILQLRRAQLGVDVLA